MQLLSTITTEDRWIIGSIVLALSGTILGAFLAEPRAFGITALTVFGLLFIVWSVTRSPRLCRSTDSPRDDSAALVRGVRGTGPSLVLSVTWGDALPHAALDHFHLGRLHVRHRVLCFAVMSTAGLGSSGDGWPIHRRRHYVLGRNMVCVTGSN